jgi:hypothetical protein
LGLTANAKLRSVEEVLDESDLIYRCFWAVRESAIRKNIVCADLEPYVTEQRHRALSWMTRFENAEWDDVPNDT